MTLAPVVCRGARIFTESNQRIHDTDPLMAIVSPAFGVFRRQHPLRTQFRACRKLRILHCDRIDQSKNSTSRSFRYLCPKAVGLYCVPSLWSRPRRRASDSIGFTLA